MEKEYVSPLSILTVDVIKDDLGIQYACIVYAREGKFETKSYTNPFHQGDGKSILLLLGGGSSPGVGICAISFVHVD